MSETTQKVAALPTKTPAFHPSNFSEESYKINRWHLFVPAGTTPEALEQPGIWAHIAYKLQPFARITVDCEDMTWSATLKVTNASKLEARVVVENVCRSEAPLPVARPEDDYEIKFAGAAKWRILRRADNTAIKSGMSSREEAQAELAGYLKALAA